MSDEPLCTDEREALDRLRGIADFFLVHNRPIVRHVDDSIVRVVLDREMVLRRARGFAPLPIRIHTEPEADPARSVLGVGAHSKNSIALAIGGNVFLSQHIGDLETEPADRAFRRVIADFEKLFAHRPANHRRRPASRLSLHPIRHPSIILIVLLILLLKTAEHRSAPET